MQSSSMGTPSFTRMISPILASAPHHHPSTYTHTLQSPLLPPRASCRHRTTRLKVKWKCFFSHLLQLGIWSCIPWTVEENTDPACCRPTVPTTTFLAASLLPAWFRPWMLYRREKGALKAYWVGAWHLPHTEGRGQRSLLDFDKAGQINCLW